MSDLRSLLENATDRIEAPRRVDRAVEESRRRRTRARAAAATAAAVVVVLAAAGTATFLGGDPTRPGPAEVPTSPLEPAPDDGPATQPLWDPFTVPDLPRGDSVLPARLAPPEVPEASVLEQPMDRVVLAWPEPGRDLRLLGSDGRWRVVPGTRDAVSGTLRPVVRPAISHDGTRVAMATLDGLLVVDVTTGTSTTLDWAAELAPPWDTPPDLLWSAADDELVVRLWKRPWVVALDGTTRRAPYRGWFAALAVDPAGPVYQNDYQLRTLLTWEDDRTVAETPFLQCERMVARNGLVACTTGSLEPFRSGPVVVDADTGDVVAYAPIRDRSSVYSDNAHLTALGFLDDETLLLLVGPADFRGDEPETEWHLVTWDFRSGAFELLTTGAEEMRTIAVDPLGLR